MSMSFRDLIVERFVYLWDALVWRRPIRGINRRRVQDSWTLWIRFPRLLWLLYKVRNFLEND